MRKLIERVKKWWEGEWSVYTTDNVYGVHHDRELGGPLRSPISSPSP